MRSFILALFGSLTILAACSGATGAEETEAIDTSGVTSIDVAQGHCGGAPGRCYGQRSFTVTFATSTLVKRQCVEAASGSDGETTRTLTPGEVRRVRDALEGVRTSSGPQSNQDGMMFGLTVTTASGRKDYSPDAACNHSNFTKIASGFDHLWSTLTAL